MNALGYTGYLNGGDTLVRVKQRRKLVALFGQSNAAGRAAAADVTVRTGYTDPFPAITLRHRQDLTTDDPIIWQDYGTQPLQPRPDSTTENFGPELALGRFLDLVSPGAYHIVQTAIGGAGLDAHLKKTAVYPTTGENAFGQTVDYLKQAEIDMGDIVAFVWVQGETDAMTSAPSLAYQTNLTQFISDMRAANGSKWSTIPFVVNYLSQNNGGSYRGNVRAAQVAVTGADATTALVMTDDLALNGGEHYLADGYVTVGERLAMATLEQFGTTQAVAADATSGIKRPANRLQWQRLIDDNSLASGLPFDCIDCQAASGNLIGAHGWLDLTPSSSPAPLYAQTLSGQASLGVGFSEASTQKFSTSAISNVSGTSWLALVHVQFAENPADDRCVVGIGTGAGEQSVRLTAGTTNPKLKVSAGSNVTGTIEYGPTELVPVVFKIDVTNGLTTVYTHKEKLAPTHGSPSGTNLVIGAGSPTTCPGMLCDKIDLFIGPAAEQTDAQVKAMLEAIGHMVTGY